MPTLQNHPRVITQAAAVDGRRTRYAIEGVKGLLLDCKPSGERTWFARYQVGHGANRTERFYRIGSFDKDDDDFKTLGQAIDAAAEVRVDAKKHKRDRFAEERTPEITGTTFEDLFTRWIERHAKVYKKSWQADVDMYHRHIRSRLGNSDATALKRRDVINVLDDIADTVSGIQANRAQALISAVLNWALSEDMLEANPAHGIRKRGQEQQRERVMSEAELKAFWGALTDQPIDRALKLLLLLGQRRDEVGRAAATELQADAWNIPGGMEGRTKNKLPHIVPLTPYARGLFGTGFKFYPTTLSHRFRDVVRGLEMADIRLHDLRHCCATGMAALGIPRDVRERVQNQVTGRRLSIGSRYDQHEYLVEKRQALERWQAEVLRLVGGEQSLPVNS